MLHVNVWIQYTLGYIQGYDCRIKSSNVGMVQKDGNIKLLGIFCVKFSVLSILPAKMKTEYEYFGSIWFDFKKNFCLRGKKFDIFGCRVLAFLKTGVQAWNNKILNQESFNDLWIFFNFWVLYIPPNA